MSKQVAGKPEGATLLDAINDGDVEFPGRMTFMDWLKWRKSTGTRPLKKRDGVSTTLEEENALWKEVMDFLHDAGEEDLEEEEVEEEEEERDVDAAVEPAPPAPHPAAGAHTGLTDEELAGLDATSVELLPDAEREAALAAAAAKSAAAPKPSSGPGPAQAGPSGPPSTAGSVPATAETLQAELRELYRPDQEPVGDYLTRLARVVLALRAYGVNVGQPELEKLTTKATLLAEEFAKIGGDWHPTRMVHALRARFSAAALRTGTEEPVDAEESQKEIQAISKLILALGGRESSRFGKVWSSPSDVLVAALGASPLTAVTSPPAPARTARPAAVQLLGEGEALDMPGGSQERRGGDSPLRARRLAAMEPSSGAPTVEPAKWEGLPRPGTWSCFRSSRMSVPPPTTVKECPLGSGCWRSGAGVAVRG